MKQRKTCVLFLAFTVLASIFLSANVLGAPETFVDVIVGFNGAPDPEVIRSYGGAVLETYSIIPAIHAILPSSAITQLTQTQEVAYITKNSQIQTSGTIRWAIEHVGAPQAWSQSTGTSIKVAVLDTGVGPVNDVKVYGGYNFIENNLDTSDHYGHGTMIAGIIAAASTSTLGIAGTAPNAEIYAVKIINDQGDGTLDQAVSGIQWAINNGMQIISMSWNLADNPALNQAVDAAYNRGILLVAAAGNAGQIMSGVGYPASYDSVIAVSAVTEENTHLTESCVGSEIELAAPGEVIYSIGLDNRTWWGTGTSYAAGYITGTAALVWAKNPTLTNIQVRNILDKTATDLQPSDGQDRDIFFGYGLVNATAAVYATPNNFDAAFTWTPQKIYANVKTFFDASTSFGGAVGFTTYVWDFGDGTTPVTTESPLIDHNFAHEGTFSVKLSVSDDFGFQNSVTKTVSVNLDSQAPVTSDDYEGKPHTTGFTITLTATDNQTGVADTFYKINSGVTQTVTENGQPLMSMTGVNKLEYWSEDNAGNQETIHTINNIIIGSTNGTEPSPTQPTPTNSSLPADEQTVLWGIIGIVIVSAAVATFVFFWLRKK
jgi:subtilisin family serine protease